MNKCCGNCLSQGGSRVGEKSSEIFCLFDKQWHPHLLNCDNYKNNVPNMSEEIRIQIIENSKNTQDTERRHKETLVSEERNRKLQIIIAIFSFFAGIFAAIIVQRILSLYK